MEAYENLVREQLNALGYNSDAIPDEVRHAARSCRAGKPSPRP